MLREVLAGAGHPRASWLLRGRWRRGDRWLHNTRRGVFKALGSGAGERTLGLHGLPTPSRALRTARPCPVKVANVGMAGSLARWPVTSPIH